MTSLVETIATSALQLFSKWPGSKSYGLAELVQKGETLVPAIIQGTEYVYVGPDDRAPVIAYHRLQSVASGTAPRTGTGDAGDDVVNTYSVGLYVYMNRKITGLTNTDMLLYLQANIPDQLTAEPYSKNVLVRFTGAILNSRTVFGTEFQGGQLRLPAEKTMFQINYTLTTQFRRGCFVKCPC